MNNWYKTDKWLKRDNCRQLVKVLNDYTYNSKITHYKGLPYYDMHYELYKDKKLICCGTGSSRKLGDVKQMEYEIRIRLLKIYHKKEG